VHGHFFAVGADHFLIEGRSVGALGVHARPLFGAAPLNFDFAMLSFHVPSTASAANAVVPMNSVLSRAIARILTIAVSLMFCSYLLDNPLPVDPDADCRICAPGLAAARASSTALRVQEREGQ